MLIEKLNKETCPIAQAAIVSNSRALARKIISSKVCPNELLSYGAKLYKISKQHPAANSLQREAERATQAAVAIKSQPEYVAWTVITDGCEFFKANGKCPPKGRLTQMYNRYGSWTLVHKRHIEKGFVGVRTSCGCAAKTSWSSPASGSSPVTHLNWFQLRHWRHSMHCCPQMREHS